MILDGVCFAIVVVVIQVVAVVVVAVVVVVVAKFWCPVGALFGV